MMPLQYVVLLLLGVMLMVSDTTGLSAPSTQMTVETNPVITANNAHLVTLEHILIPPGPLLTMTTPVTADGRIATTGADPGIYVCQTDQSYIDDPESDEPHFGSRLFRGCQWIQPERGIGQRATLPTWSPDATRLAFSVEVGIGIIDVPDEGFGEGIKVEVMSLKAPGSALDWQMMPDADNLNLIEALHWSPDGTLVYAIDTEHVIYVWHSVTGELLREIPAPDAEGYVWSPDGTHLIGWDETHITVMSFDGQSLSPVNTLQRGDFGMPVSAALTPNGTRLAVWNSRGAGDVQLYDLTGSAPPQNLTVTETWLSAVAWSPDGLLLATGDFAGSLRLWDAQSGNPLHEIYINTNPAFSPYIYDIAWSPDGTRIVTVSHDEAVRTWAIPTE